MENIQQTEKQSQKSPMKPAASALFFAVAAYLTEAPSQVNNLEDIAMYIAKISSVLLAGHFGVKAIENTSEENKPAVRAGIQTVASAPMYAFGIHLLNNNSSETPQHYLGWTLMVAGAVLTGLGLGKTAEAITSRNDNNSNSIEEFDTMDDSDFNKE